MIWENRKEIGMLQLRHVGMYVEDLAKETRFYMAVFDMRCVCQNIRQNDEMIHELVGGAG